jgi:5-methylthioadenosine/S-adenosylhomocysteine deaminase
MAILFRNVRVFSQEPAEGSSGETHVLVDGNTIRAVGDEAARLAPADAEVVEGKGDLLIPGLINAHFHSPVNHMKGMLPSLPLEIFMLYESPDFEPLRPSPREAYVRTMLAAMEMLRNGTTSVQDDAFFVPHPTPDIIDAVMQAYRDVGIRATVALDQPELAELDKLPFLAEMLPETLRAELREPPVFGRARLLECYRHLIETWHGHDGGRLSAAVSCSAPQRVSPDYMGELDALSRAHDLPFYTHMLETKLQRVLADEQPRFEGRSLVRYTADLGFLSERMNVIHAIWMDDADYDLIAEAGTSVAHNPISNLRLGSGVMPFRKLRDRGINVCLGTDEAIADDAVNMWSVAKMAGLIHNIGGPDYGRWPTASEILECLFQGGAQAMRRGESLGSVEPGKLADLALVNLDSAAFTPLNDVHRQMVYCENGSSVRLTMVAGRIVFDGNRLATVDEAAIRAEAREIFSGRQGALTAARLEADRWLPYYQQMVSKAAARDIHMNRWLGYADEH